MDLKSKKIRIALMIVLAIIALLTYRIVSNIMASNELAKKSSVKADIAVPLGMPEIKSIQRELRFSGSLDPVWQADVSSKVDGHVEKILVDEGSFVSAGQRLAQLEEADTSAALMSARGNFLDAETSLAKANDDLNRYEKLYERGAISEQSLATYRFAKDNAYGKYEAAKGNYEAARSKSDGASIVTPRDGIVAKRYYQEGYYAKAGTPLFNIVDISSLSAKINIPEGYIDGVVVGSKVKFTIPSLNNKVVDGTVTKVSPMASTSSRSFEAEVSIANPNNQIRGGIYADAVVQMEPKNNVLVIPLSAIVMRDDQRTVYVIENGIAVRRVIMVGYIGDGEVEVLSGISKEDTIITGGQNKVREGSKIAQGDKGNN